MPVTPLSLPPKDAIAYFRQKGMRTGFAYQDVWQDEHAKAFTVAKAMNVDILEDIRGALDTAMMDGQTFEHFKKQLAPILQAKGWWGKKEMVDPLTGETVLAQLGSDRRLKTIFATNMRVSYQHGNWQRAWATRAALPYMIYHHNSHKDPRPEHEAWDRVCRPVDDPWWETHYPICAWGCKCSTESVSASMLADMGLKVTAQGDIPTFKKTEYVNPRTGEKSMVEQGIDPAWNYNIGKSPLRGITARPGVAPAGAPSAPFDQLKPAVDQFTKAMGADAQGKIMTDKSGWPLAVGRDLFTNPSGELATPRPDLLHELPRVAEAIKTYDTVAWHWGESGVGFDQAGLERVITEASTAGNATVRARLGKATPWLVKAAKAEGHAIQDFDRVLDAATVRHIRTRHGSAEAQEALGQLAITDKDLRALPQITSAPEFMVTGLKDKGGRDLIAYVAQLGDERFVYIEEIRPRRWQLAAKTLWKYPATVDARTLASSLIHNARSGSGAAPKVIDLRGKIKPPPVPLIRRYTKALDNHVVTVDFSNGTWTYDVRPEPTS